MPPSKFINMENNVKGWTIMEAKVNVQEYDIDGILLNTTEVDSLIEAEILCKESTKPIVAIHRIFQGEINSIQGVRKSNGYIDWKRINE
jgi:hypothetical protein